MAAVGLDLADGDRPENSGATEGSKNEDLAMIIFERALKIFHKIRSALVPVGDGSGRLVETHLKPADVAAAAALRRLPELGRLNKAVLYSGALIGPSHAPNPISFFTEGVGELGPYASPLTLETTNMEAGGSLPAGTSFIVERLGILFAPSCDPLDIKMMCNLFRVELVIENVIAFQSPLAFMFAVRDLPPDEAAMVKELRVSRECLQADLTPLPIVLFQGLAFRVDLIADRDPWPDPLVRQRLTNLRVWAVLEGQRAGEVQ